MNWLKKGEANNVVYDDISEKDNLLYVGITKQKLEKRMYQHNRGDKNFNRLNVKEKN